MDQVQHPQAFPQHFVDQLDQYPIHVPSHPPGQVLLLLLWGLDRIGLGGSGPATVQTLLFAALATAGVLTVTKWEGGETAFRRAAVFVGLTPAAWTVATSTDPTFSGLAVLSVVPAFAAERASPRAALPPFAAAGATLCCYFSYDPPLFLLPAIIQNKGSVHNLNQSAIRFGGEGGRKFPPAPNIPRTYESGHESLGPTARRDQ